MQVLPDWGLDKQFVVRVHQVVLSSDSYLSSQALQSVASTPSQISNKFGTISYSKGKKNFTFNGSDERVVTVANCESIKYFLQYTYNNYYIFYYTKSVFVLGGSVLRMVEHIMGSENFKAGVRNYLQIQ